MIISESGMNFGEFAEGNIFRVEQCKELPQGIKAAEFISIDPKNRKVIILEAKTSAPNPDSPNHPARFREYIEEIEQKLCNSLDFFAYQGLNHALPAGFSAQRDYHQFNFLLILVIKNQKAQWLPPVQKALNEAVNRHIRFPKIWKARVLVLNEEGARRKNLIH